MRTKVKLLSHLLYLQTGSPAVKLSFCLLPAGFSSSLFSLRSLLLATLAGNFLCWGSKKKGKEILKRVELFGWTRLVDVMIVHNNDKDMCDLFTCFCCSNSSLLRIKAFSKSASYRSVVIWTRTGNRRKEHWIKHDSNSGGHKTSRETVL